METGIIVGFFVAIIVIGILICVPPVILAWSTPLGFWQSLGSLVAIGWWTTIPVVAQRVMNPPARPSAVVINHHVAGSFA